MSQKLWETAMGMGDYAGSPAQKEDLKVRTSTEYRSEAITAESVGHWEKAALLWMKVMSERTREMPLHHGQADFERDQSDLVRRSRYCMTQHRQAERG